MANHGAGSFFHSWSLALLQLNANKDRPMTLLSFVMIVLGYTFIYNWLFAHHKRVALQSHILSPASAISERDILFAFIVNIMIVLLSAVAVACSSVWNSYNMPSSPSSPHLFGRSARTTQQKYYPNFGIVKTTIFILHANRMAAVTMKAISVRPHRSKNKFNWIERSIDWSTDRTNE